MHFTSYMPVKFFFGKGCVREHGAVLKTLGKNALIVTGGNSSRKNGSLDDMIAVLDENNIVWHVFDQTLPNPPVENVREAAGLAKDKGVDFIIGIGGGSPLDAAKAVAVLAMNELTDQQLFENGRFQTALPVVAVPTTAGTGSEATPYAILTDTKDKTKKNLSSPLLYPVFSFLDVAYTQTLPYDITVNTAIDALSHAVESYLSKRASYYSSILAIKAMEELTAGFSGLSKDKVTGVEAREKFLLGSLIAGMAIAHTGTTVVHAMGYPLTFYNNIDHGRANGYLLAAYLEFIGQTHEQKVNNILSALGLNSMTAFHDLINHHLEEQCTLSEETIQQFAAFVATAKSTNNTCSVPTLSQIETIYRKSLS